MENRDEDASAFWAEGSGILPLSVLNVVVSLKMGSWHEYEIFVRNQKKNWGPKGGNFF